MRLRYDYVNRIAVQASTQQINKSAAPWTSRCQWAAPRPFASCVLTDDGFGHRVTFFAKNGMRGVPAGMAAWVFYPDKEG